MASQHRGRQQDGSVWDASSPPVAWAVSAWQGMSAKLNAASTGPGGKARASTKEIATSAAMRRRTFIRSDDAFRSAPAQLTISRL